MSYITYYNSSKHQSSPKVSTSEQFPNEVAILLFCGGGSRAAQSWPRNDIVELSQMMRWGGNRSFTFQEELPLVQPVKGVGTSELKFFLSSQMHDYFLFPGPIDRNSKLRRASSRPGLEAEDEPRARVDGLGSNPGRIL